MAAVPPSREAASLELAIGIMTALREVLLHQGIKLRLRHLSYHRELTHIEIGNLSEQLPAYRGLHHEGISNDPHLFIITSHKLTSDHLGAVMLP